MENWILLSANVVPTVEFFSQSINYLHILGGLTVLTHTYICTLFACNHYATHFIYPRYITCTSLYTWLLRHNFIAPCNASICTSYAFISLAGTYATLSYLLLAPTCISDEPWRGSSSLRTWGTNMGRTCPYVTYAWRHQLFKSPTKKNLLLGDLGDLLVLDILHAAKHNQHTPSGPTWRVGPRPRHAGPSPTPELPRHGESRPRPRREASLPCLPKAFMTSKCI